MAQQMTMNGIHRLGLIQGDKLEERENISVHDMGDTE
jgi:hypothetical protein